MRTLFVICCMLLTACASAPKHNAEVVINCNSNSKWPDKPIGKLAVVQAGSSAQNPFAVPFQGSSTQDMVTGVFEAQLLAFGVDILPRAQLGDIAAEARRTDVERIDLDNLSKLSMKVGADAVVVYGVNHSTLYQQRKAMYGFAMVPIERVAVIARLVVLNDGQPRVLWVGTATAVGDPNEVLIADEYVAAALAQRIPVTNPAK